MRTITIECSDGSVQIVRVSDACTLDANEIAKNLFNPQD